MMKEWIHPKWSEKAFRDKAFWLVFVILCVGMLWGQVSRDFFIGISKYKESCIEGGRVMIVNKSTAGTLDSLEKGEIAAFVNEKLNEKLGRKVIGAKYIAAVAGDYVVVKDGVISINGVVWGELDLVSDGVLKEEVSSFDKSFVVSQGEVLMLGTTRSSYDGRYWGTVSAKDIVGRAYVIL